MSDYLADRYAAQNAEPTTIGPAIAAAVGLTIGLGAFVWIFSDIAARSAMAVIEADRLLAGAAW